jgi:cytochrome c oxidase subunit II
MGPAGSARRRPLAVGAIRRGVVNVSGDNRSRSRSSRWASIGFLGLLAFLLMAQLAVAQAQGEDEPLRDVTLREGRGLNPTGEIIGDIWIKIIWVSSAIFLLVTAILLYSLVRWRRRPGVKREVPQTHGNSKLEIAWTIGPALVMIWLLVISYNGLMAIDLPEEEPEIFIDVIGHRFFWEFVYPDGTSSVGANAVLRLEEGRWVRLNVTTSDVIHAFKIPSLNVMIDAPPGRENLVLFYTGHELGLHMVQCRQFCGTGHGEMLASLEIFAAGSQPQPFGAPPRPQIPTEPAGNETEGPEVDRRIEVVMRDMEFDPVPIEVEPGQTIEIAAFNEGPSPHNLYIGTYDRGMRQGQPVCPEGAEEEDCWRTRESVLSGQADSFVFTVPDESIAFDLWCNVPGHAQLGMLSYFSVGGAVPDTGDGVDEPRLPGPGLVLLVAAMGALLLVLRRRA